MAARFSGIYEIKNKANGHRYIGSSVNVSNRLWRHKRNLLLNKHCNAYLQSAWNKYGEDSFTFTPLFYCDKDNALFYEQKCIDGMRPEYNLASDAIASARGLKKSEEHKRKISESNKGKHSEWVGRRHTEVTRQRMSESAKGKVHTPMTEEWKHKISEALAGRPFTDEHRRKISEGAKKRWARVRGGL